MKKKLLLGILLVCITSNAQEPNKSNVQELIKEFKIAPSLPAKGSKTYKTLLWDQNPGVLGDTTPVLINTHSNQDDAAIWTADDFQLTSASEITKIKIFGAWTSGTLDNLTGVDLYIYTNSSDNLPSGDPSEAGTGLLEIINLDPTSTFLELEHSTEGFHFIFDIEAYNGSPLPLQEGIYWVSFFPRIDNFTYADPDWNMAWFAYPPDANITNTLSYAQYIDKEMIFGDDSTTWSSLEEATVSNLAFTIEGTTTLSVDEFEENSLSIYPNPTNGPLTIDNPSDDGSIVTHYTVFDINGRKMSTGKETGMFNLNMEALSAGPYFLQLDLPNRSITTKIIKK